MALALDLTIDDQIGCSVFVICRCWFEKPVVKPNVTKPIITSCKSGFGFQVQMYTGNNKQGID